MPKGGLKYDGGSQTKSMYGSESSPRKASMVQGGKKGKGAVQKGNSYKASRTI